MEIERMSMNILEMSEEEFDIFREAMDQLYHVETMALKYLIDDKEKKKVSNRVTKIEEMCRKLGTHEYRFPELKCKVYPLTAQKSKQRSLS